MEITGSSGKKIFSNQFILRLNFPSRSNASKIAMKGDRGSDYVPLNGLRAET